MVSVEGGFGERKERKPFPNYSPPTTFFRYECIHYPPFSFPPICRPGGLDWVHICQASNKVITFIDLAGHEKYLKTTIFGMTGHAPDFCMLMVGSNAGIIGMTKGTVIVKHFHHFLKIRLRSLKSLYILCVYPLSPFQLFLQSILVWPWL